MTQLDKQHRLLIPSRFTSYLNLSGQVGIFWDANSKAIFLSDLVDCADEFCIAIRYLDKKNRITISDSILELINSNMDSKLIVALKNNRIYIFNAD